MSAHASLFVLQPSYDELDGPQLGEPRQLCFWHDLDAPLARHAAELRVLATTIAPDPSEGGGAAQRRDAAQATGSAAGGAVGLPRSRASAPEAFASEGIHLVPCNGGGASAVEQA
jgi:hypothetical protein